LIGNAIRRLAAGFSVDSKRVGKGVYELRVHYGPGYRVYFAKHGIGRVILLLAGDKGSQKVDIERAVSYWKDYKGEYGEKSR